MESEWWPYGLDFPIKRWYIRVDRIRLIVQDKCHLLLFGKLSGALRLFLLCVIDRLWSFALTASCQHRHADNAHSEKYAQFLGLCIFCTSCIDTWDYWTVCKYDFWLWVYRTITWSCLESGILCLQTSNITGRNHSTIAANGDKWVTKAESYVGNGPFKITEMKTGESMTLEKNENYWGADDVTLASSLRCQYTKCRIYIVLCCKCTSVTPLQTKMRITGELMM